MKQSVPSSSPTPNTRSATARSLTPEEVRLIDTRRSLSPDRRMTLDNLVVAFALVGGAQ